MNTTALHELLAYWMYVMPQAARPMLAQVTDSCSATAGASVFGDDNSDHQAKGRDIYTETKNLPTAVASIMNHAQNRANFHPAASPPEILYESFQQYINEIDKTPFFHLTKHDSVRQSFASKDYNRLIGEIVSMYDSVSTEDKDKIKESIIEMGKSVFGQEKSEQFRNLFSQSSISFENPNQPKVLIYYTKLHMKHVSGKAELNDQDYSVSRAEYVVLAELVHVNADSLVALDTRTIDEWVKESTSKKNENMKLCFE
jgi:hypothetical protein